MIILGIPNISSNQIAILLSFFIIIFTLVIGCIWIIFRALKFSRFSYSKIGKKCFLFSIIPISIIWAIVLVNFVNNWYNNSPTNVSKSKLKGLYEIDTLYFKGKNSKWQYHHYKLEINDDYLKLIILNKNKVIKDLKTKITNIEIDNRSFFIFHDDYYSDYYIKNANKKNYYFSIQDSIKHSKRDYKIVNDTSKHHMLRVNPSLLLNAHNFRIVLYSTKYKNMFFKKVD